jgi:predicted nucleic acid-binding protein
MRGRGHGVLVETDLIAAFLVAPADPPPLLRRLLEVVPCYSTFIQAAEIYAAAPAPEERRTVERALFGLKILGASARYAKTIADVLTSLGTLPDHRTAIVAAMALESRLPIVTAVAAGRYGGIPGVRVVPADLLDRTRTPEELLELIG